MVKGRWHGEGEPRHHGGGWRRVLVKNYVPPVAMAHLHSSPDDTCHVCLRRMSFADWCKFFTEADVCRLINTSVISVHKTWNEVVHFGSWTKNADPLLNRCGGCANHKPTFLQNPQVLAQFGRTSLLTSLCSCTTCPPARWLTVNFFHSICLTSRRSSTKFWSPCSRETWRCTENLVKEKI